MKKKILLILFLIIILNGCSTNSNLKNTEVIEKNVLVYVETVDGIIKNKYIKNDLNYFEIEDEDGFITTLTLQNPENFDILKVGEYYSFEYDKEDNSTVKFQKADKPSRKDDEKIKKIIKLENNIDFENLNELKSFSSEILSEYGITKVSVYTDAQVDSNGEFIWDDGNRFLLIAHKENSGYILYDQRLQAGNIDFNVFTIDEKLNISLNDTSTADINFRIFEYVNGNFEENILYNGSGNINMLF